VKAEPKQDLSLRIREAVAQVWAEVLERHNIGPNENFFDLGGDSLKALEVIARLHALTGVELPLIAFFEDPTIVHLSEVLADLQPVVAPPANGAVRSANDTISSAVAQVWSEVLGRESIGTAENFFDLGGDSLKALEVISRLQELLKIDVPLIAFFEDPTISHLVEVAEKLRPTVATASALPLSTPRTEAPLSFEQLQYWLLQQAATAGHLHSNARVFRIRGEFDPDVLKSAFDRLCKRHQVLSSRIQPGIDEPVQIADPNPDVAVELQDLSTFPLNQRGQRALQLAQEEWRKQIDLSKEPPLRARLFRLSEHDHLLVIIIHHVVSDGNSGSIFFEELAAIYNGLLKGTAPSLEPLAAQYFDYAVAERSQMQGERLEKELEFWREYLDGAPSSASLPTDKPRPQKTGNSGSRISVLVPPATLERLGDLARTTGSTLFTVLLSGLRILLYHWAGERDTVIGTVASTRSRASTERMIGCFVNFLPFRNGVSESETALDILDKEKRAVRDAFAHQECPFLKIVTSATSSRLTDANPVYNVALLLQNFPEIKFAGEKFTGELIELESGFALLDLRFIATERSTGLELDCEFNKELFRAGTVEHLLDGFASLLGQMAENPSQRISEFQIPEGLVRQAEASVRREQPCTIAITSSFTSELVQAPLAFWMNEFGVRTNFRFAPYNQVFQQLLDPNSLISKNRDGFNIIPLRLTDWVRLDKDLSDTRKKEKIQSSVHELTGTLKKHPPVVPTIICICPPEKQYEKSDWAAFLATREREIAGAIGGIPGVHLITSGDISAHYPLQDYADEYTDKLGHVPYTADFFAALATTIARRMFAVSTEAKKVIVLDAEGVLWDDQVHPRTIDSRRNLQEFLLRQFEVHGILLCLVSKESDENIDRLLGGESGMPLGPEHFVARRTSAPSVAAAVQELAEELQLPLEGFIVFSADSDRCREIESRFPEVLTLRLPANPEEIPAFLQHVWALDLANQTPASDPRFSNANQVIARTAGELRDLPSIRHAIDAAQLTERKPTVDFVGPRTPSEEIVAAAWAQVLKLDRVGVHDNFFALGGHSLLGTQVVARIRQMFEIEIPLRAIFEAPTVAEFSRRIESQRKSGSGMRAASIPKVADREHLPLSFGQQRLWFLDQLDPGNPLYNMAQKIRLRGKLEVSALQQAVNRMVKRHEALRTSFTLRNGEPVQAIARDLVLAVPIIDLSSLPGDQREAEIEKRTGEEARLPFDLSTGPVMRAQILRVQPDDHLLLLTMHHIVSDRWSLGVAATELAEHYCALIEHRPSQLPDLAVQYADFSVWQRKTLEGDVLNQQLQYWKKKLEGAPSLLEIPADHPRPAQMSMRGAWLHHVVPQNIVNRLTALSQEEGVTLFMTLLAAFQTLMSRYSGQNDVVIASPIAGRNFAELEPLIGFFVNTLALRGDLSGDPSFRQLLARTKETCLEGYACQEIPFEKLVEELQPERSLSHNPICQVLFAHQNAPMQMLQLPGVELERTAVHPGTSILDMSWFAMDVPEGMLIRVEYNTDLFEADTIARALEHFSHLLESVLADPTQPISQLTLLGENERHRLLVEFNANETEFPTLRCMHELVEQSASRTPDAVAVICGDDRITYQALNDRANQIAHHLIKLGAGPEVLIGVFLERNSDLLPAILGVLKSGSAYVPLDPSYPRERIAAILEDAKASIVLTQQALLTQVRGSVPNCICVDADWKEIAAGPTENPQTAVKPENLGYVLFTSGSTGRPKGVALEHQSAVTFVHWAQTVFTPGELAGVLLSTSVCFDLSIFEIFVPLSVGGKVIVVQNALYLPSADAKDEVTLINTVPSAMAELVQMKAVPSSVKTVNLAGEALPESLVNEIYRATPVEKVYNLYGPTEDTTYSTYTLTHAHERVTIGRPLPNTQAYVLDRHGNPQPIGVPGELHLAGAGMARGYYGRPELTAERFLPNAFSRQKNARMYRTGDLCRWLRNGNLEYLGRLDHQVKLRGFRIELGEIESVLVQHAGVRQCLVIPREDEPGLRRLVAYVVAQPGQAPQHEELRDHLKLSLPEFMIPSAFVGLDAFPLTPNGKINRKALPIPEYAHQAAAFVAPRNWTEEQIAGIWAKVLRIKQVGATDDFFALGGHSLLATQVVSRIRQSLNVEVPLRALFEAPTVAQLAQRVEALGKTTPIPAITRALRNRNLPLSFAQQRLWFLNELEPDNPLYNIPIAVAMSGELSFDALEHSLNEIVRRHEVLRTTFRVENNQPIQVIAPDLKIKVEVFDLTGVPAVEQQDAVNRMAIEGASAIFNLRTGPLFRAAVLHLNQRDHVLLLNMHHIVSDGWSLWQFVKELAALYAAYVQGAQPPLEELAIQYADYGVWQRQWMQGGVLDQHLEYWKKQLAGAPGVLELPADRIRPAVQTYRGATETALFPPNLLARLKEISAAEGATLFMTLLAAYQTLIFRYTGQEDVVVGTPIANRTRAEIEELIGFFVNALVMRTDLSGDPGFREVVGRVRAVALGAYAHQDLPFEKLVEVLQPERDLTRTPLFQVWFALQNAPRTEFKLPGLDLRTMAVHNGTSKFDLGLFVVEKPEGLSCMVEYSTDLFDASTIQRFIGHFRTLLEGIAASPDMRISDLPWLSSAERHQIVEQWNDTQVEYSRQLCLHQIIEQQAQKTPEAPALIFESETLTYRELNERANQLAHWLRRIRVGPDVLVGVCAERSVEMVVALLGTMKAGGAYVPLDPDYPRERLASVLEDAAPAAVLTQERMLGVLPENAIPVLCLDSNWSRLSDEPRTNPDCITNGKDQAYAIFTSGSTGKPKGVPNVHQGIVNRLLWMQDAYRLDGNDRVMQKTPYSFDVSVWEFFWPLMTGACLVVAIPEGHKDPNYLIDVIRRQQITTMHFVPSMLRMFLEAEGVEQCTSLRRVICSGEALPVDVQKRFFERLNAELHNLYGPTEASVDVTYWRCLRSDTRNTVPIGKPIWNTQIYILDKHLRPVPIGIPGELHIGGVGLARGYLNRPQLTAEKFIPDPFCAEPGARLYKTGDLARFLPDGNVEYLGRMDYQVKIRGFRIELGEIESVLEQHPAVGQAVVMAREDQPGDKRLAAYVVADPEYRGEEQAGGEFLSAEQVAQWAMTFDEAYRQGGSAEDATFNIVGWNSSYTGKPIPPADMRVWVETTVQRILALQPKRVWEIGCGTGLLLFRVAPKCETFHGTDVSQRALDFLEQQMQRPDLRLPQVSLECRAANDFDGVQDDQRFDTIVINSVTQYFPDLDYLVKVLAGALRRVRPGGSIFLGDIRNFRLLEAFHTSVEVYRQPESTAIAELKALIKKGIRQEGELLVDPEFFSTLNRRFPEIARVEMQLKRGRMQNELTRFRYDVVLHVGTVEPEKELDCHWIDWQRQSLSLASLREILKNTRSTCLGVSGVPNARVADDITALNTLADGSFTESLASLRARIAEKRSEVVEPEEIWALESEFDYAAEIRSSFAATDGKFDILFRKKDAPGGAVRFPGEALTLRPNMNYATNPVRTRALRNLAPDLRAWLGDKLPEFMVPSNFVLLERMPLSANGKVDRKALPVPDQSRLEDRGAYVAPRLPEQEVLASIWSDVLRIERVGIRDDFFGLGGHSLNATQVVARVREAFKVEMPLRTLFESPTIESLARAITALTRRQEGQEIPPIVPVSRDQQVPLSFAQQRLWFLDQMEPGTHLYNIPRAFRLAGTLDIAALESALNDLIGRHEILRTNYQLGDADQPVQVIAPKVTIELPVIDLSGIDSLRREQEAERIVQQETDRGFDLVRDPILRAVLLKLSDAEHVLFMNTHHIASDGWSSGVMLNDLCSFYEAAVMKRPASLPPLAIQYADYSFWQRKWLQGEVLTKQLTYWKKQLAGAPPFLALPTDQARSPVQTYRGAMLETALPKGLVEGLGALGRQQGATMFMTMLAGFECLMHYSTGQNDIVLGTDLANRASVETESLIGFFVNLLPLRVDLSGDPSFLELINKVREVSLSAYAHQDVTFDKLVEELKPERNLSYSPLVQVLFVQQNTPRSTTTMPGIEMSRFRMEVQSKFDMAVFMRETDREVVGWWQYNPDLFDETTISRLAASYELILQAAISNPKARVSSLCELLAEADKNRRGSDQVKVQKAGLEKLKKIRRKAVADA